MCKSFQLPNLGISLNTYSLVPEVLMSVRMTESRPVEGDYRMLDLKGNLKGNLTTTSSNYEKEPPKFKHQRNYKSLSFH